MMIRRLLPLIFSTLLATSLVGCDTDADRSHDFSKAVIPAEFVEHNGAYYTMKCPPTWKGTYEKDFLILTAPLEKNETNPPLVNVSIMSLPDAPIKKGVREIEKSLAKKIEDWKLQKSDPAILPSTTEGWELIYTGNSNGFVPRKWMTVIARRGTSGYVITFSANPARFDKLYPTVEQMLSSFQVHPMGTPEPTRPGSTSHPTTSATTKP